MGTEYCSSGLPTEANFGPCQKSKTANHFLKNFNEVKIILTGPRDLCFKIKYSKPSK